MRLRANVSSSMSFPLGLVLSWPTALPRLPHSLNLAVVVRATIGGGLAALASEGYGMRIFRHTRKLQKPLAVVKGRKCINSKREKIGTTRIVRGGIGSAPDE